MGNFLNHFQGDVSQVWVLGLGLSGLKSQNVGTRRKTKGLHL